MSYILDALQRAKAERERGAVPGLHTQALPAPKEAPALHGAAQASIWVAAVLGAVGLGALAVHLARPTSPATPVTRSAPPSPPPAPVSIPPVAATPAPPPQVSAAALAAASAALRTAPAPAPAAPPPAPSAAAPARAASAAASVPAGAPAAERIYALNELPSEVRAQLPAVTISGASYSENAAQRLLIVNGNVVQERGVVAPEVVLEQIGERSAVLRFRDYRYRIAY